MTQHPENQTIKERLILFVKYKKIGQGKFEALSGLSNGYINNIRKSIQPDKLQRIVHSFPELNPGWLMTGEGQMLKRSPDDVKIMNYATPPTDVVMSREVFNQITKLTETLLAQQQLLSSQQRTIDKLLSRLQ